MSEFSICLQNQYNFHFFLGKVLLLILNTVIFFKTTETYSIFLKIKTYSIGFNYSLVSKTTCNKGAQWLSGGVLDSRPRG